MRRHEWERDKKFIEVAVALWAPDLEKALGGHEGIRCRMRHRWQGFRYTKVIDDERKRIENEQRTLKLLESLRGGKKASKKRKKVARG